jgi:aquaporin Z
MPDDRYSPHLGFSGMPKEVIARITGFDDPTYEWRRLFSELFGTFFLVLVAAGAGMMDVAFPGQVGRAASVVAPGLMVMAMIMFMGRVSGAHFNPAVSLGFALRGDFPWRRVPAYFVAQIAGAVAAAAVLQSILHVSASRGSNYPAHSTTMWAAFLMEALLTLGLLSVILGTASGAQNVGIIGALAVGAYIGLAGLWASPLSGASMNPFRTLGPDVVANDYHAYWVYLAGPLAGMLVAVLFAWVLRGAGGGRSGSLAAQGSYNPVIGFPDKD